MVEETLAAVAPVEEAGKFGAFLLQLTPAFSPKDHKLEELRPLLEALAPRTVAVELRHRGWVDEKRLQDTLDFLADRGAAFVGGDSFAEAAARAELGLGGAPAGVVVVFVGAPNLAHAAEGMPAVAERLHPAAAIGCGAQGVVGEAREVELGGVAVWAAALGGG